MLSQKALQYSIAILIRSLFISALLIQITVPPSSHAQSAITSDGTMGTAVTYDTGNYTISAGTIRGSNQFHSFGRFNVPTAESATFTGPPAIENIIGRVTGGEVSGIYGTIVSMIDGANLFLLNPAGILFGPNARLDVKGSFHASTADYLKLGEGGIFYSDPAGATVLAVASPTAFGFLDGNPAGISIRRSELLLPEGETLSLVGGDIEIVGAGVIGEVDEVVTITIPSGRVNIASVASAGEVITNGPGEVPDLNLESFEGFGEIAMSQQAVIDLRGNPGGTVLIRGGRFFMEVARIDTGTTGDIDHPGVGIDIDVSGDIVLDPFGTINSSSSGPGDAGNILLTAANISVNGDPQSDVFTFGLFSNIASRVFDTGAGGNIEVSTGSLDMNNNAILVTQVFGPGDGGDLTITTEDLQVWGDTGLAFISTSTFNLGDAGKLDINAESVTLRGGTGFSGLASQVASGGDAIAGDLSLTTGSLEVLDGAQINAALFGGSKKGSRAGNINVTADTIIISGINAGGFPAGIFADVNGDTTEGSGGNISITANDLQMRDRGRVSVSVIDDPTDPLVPSGNSGNIAVEVGNLQVADNASITTFNSGTGAAGNIDVSAANVLLSGNSLVSARSSGLGNAGNITFNVADLFQMSDSSVITEAVQADGGDIKINAGNMVYLGDSVISASVGGGSDTVGGNIFIDPEFVILNNSQIIANAFEGRGGNIRIVAGTFLADPESIVDASSEKGIDGTVEVRAPITDVTRKLKPLPKSFKSPAELLLESCIARLRGGEYSSFIVGGRDGLPLEPGSLLPSPLLLQ